MSFPPYVFDAGIINHGDFYHFFKFLATDHQSMYKISMNANVLKSFLSFIQNSFLDETFVRLNLAEYKGEIADLKKIIIRAVIIKKQKHLSFTYRYKTRDIVKNFLIDDAAIEIEKNLKDGFLSATLFTTLFDLSYPSLKQSKPTQKPDETLSHDRIKNRNVDTVGKTYLQDLKITDDKGVVLKSSQDKFKQIDKYIEILSGLIKIILGFIKDINKSKIKKIVDMGSGKGYLTFALYDYLYSKMNLNPSIVGVEYRNDMVELCNKISKKSGFDGLTFTQGSIDDYDAKDTSILIALHACDTATDDAIAKGIDAGAELIVVAPCCHKQIRRQMDKNKTHDDVAFMTRHGIFMERMAEMVTDSLRALYLEYSGYEVKVFEFISGEHTAKNVMLVATKAKITSDQKHKIKDNIDKIKSNFGIDYHALEKSVIS